MEEKKEEKPVSAQNEKNEKKKLVAATPNQVAEEELDGFTSVGKGGKVSKAAVAMSSGTIFAKLSEVLDSRGKRVSKFAKCSYAMGRFTDVIPI